MTDTIHQFGRAGLYHKLYQYSDGRVSILDSSGDRPETSDDGPLIVQPGTVCELDALKNGEIIVIVPVLCTRGNRDGLCYVGLPVAERLFELVPKLRLSKNDGYRLAEVRWLRASLLFNQFGISPEEDHEFETGAEEEVDR